MSIRFRLLNLEPNDFSASARAKLEGYCDYAEMSDVCPDRLSEEIREFDGIIVRLGYNLNRSVFRNAPNLKLIACATTGLTHIDLEAASAFVVKVISLRGADNFLRTITPTAELTIAFILMLARNLKGAIRCVEAFRWDRSLYFGRELNSLTLGIIGYGSLGNLVAKFATGLGMKVIAHDLKNKKQFETGIEYRSLDNLLGVSDIVSVHVHADPHNINLCDKDFFSKMKRGAFFINTSRGEIVDEVALLDALVGEHLGGSALDVLSGEGLGSFPSQHPLVKFAANNDNVLITPHIGGAAFSALHKCEDYIAKEIINWIACFEKK